MNKNESGNKSTYTSKFFKISFSILIVINSVLVSSNYQIAVRRYRIELYLGYSRDKSFEDLLISYIDASFIVNIIFVILYLVFGRRKPTIFILIFLMNMVSFMYYIYNTFFLYDGFYYYDGTVFTFILLVMWGYLMFRPGWFLSKIRS